MLLPPEGYFKVSAPVLFSLQLPAPIRDTYATLRAFAWAGYETPELSWAEIEQATGKDRKTLYRHLLTLANTGVTRWRTASVGHIRLTFTDGIGGAENCLKIETSQKREVAIKESNLLEPELKPDSKRLKESARLKIETSQKRETAPASSPATMRGITDAYVALLGYDPGDWSAGEGKAASWLAARYTVAQFQEAYAYYKAQAFWADKRLSLKIVKSNIGEYFAAKTKGTLNATSQRPHQNGSSQTRSTAQPRSTGVYAPRHAGYRVETELPSTGE